PISAWNRLWREEEKVNDPQQKILQDRQAKAEKAYAELKRSGFKGTQVTPTAALPIETPTTQHDSAPLNSQTTSFRDSAIDVDDLRPSGESKRDSRAVDEVMPAPSIPFTRAISPMPSTSGRRASLNLRTPSLNTLKRVGSHLQLPSSKRHSAQESIFSTTESVNSDASLRKQPSKKDLLKQQRLHKKVSNLEAKLEAARRELEEAQGLVPETTSTAPTRKAFTPGALPSLPSERLLKDNVDGASGANSQVPIAPKVDTLPGANLRSKFSVNMSPETKTTGHTSRKRKSSQMNNVIIFPNLAVKPAEGGDSAAPESVSKRPRNSPKTVAPKSKPRPLPRTQSEHDIHDPQKPESRKRATATEPPVPALPPPFDPSQVDRIKIMMMRNSSDYGEIPFGRSPMDAMNLRKAYPLITDEQVDEVLGRRASDLKTTDFTSTAHHAPKTNNNRAPTTPTVDVRPRSVSPTTKDGFKPSISKSSLRSRGRVPVPNNTPTSARKTAQEQFEEIAHEAADRSKEEMEMNGAAAGGGEEEKDTVAPLPPSSEPATKGLPPYPKDPSVTVQTQGKPLPGVQREEYQWDEDVF
ncbi:MAG: hypothetical protein Q9191_008351, partial [Dirinaria sp. TL-2023a]